MAAPTVAMAGRGGDVVAVCVDGLNTLIDYRYRQHFKADRGTDGMGKARYGGGGKESILELPVGTQVFAEDGGNPDRRPDQGGRAHYLARGRPGWPGQHSL